MINGGAREGHSRSKMQVGHLVRCFYPGISDEATKDRSGKGLRDSRGSKVVLTG